jgi:hypothetical protein
MNIAWFSCGITSAVACKIALQKYNDVELYYTHIGSQHYDSLRFLRDCEQWFGKKINIRQNEMYNTHFDIYRDFGFIKIRKFTQCTMELKIKIRRQIEDEIGIKNIEAQIFGFDISEKHRAENMQALLTTKCVFPLIESKLDKSNCIGIIQKVGIEIPEMYKMGFHNNNCIGCPKGGMGYWNKIRNDFPDVFKEAMNVENKIKHSILRNGDGSPLFLKDLDPKRGDYPTEIMPNCGLFCDLELDFIKHGND